LGMVSKIFPADELADSALAYARRIAAVPTMAALLIKESVNQSVDQMGFYNALNACFTIHELNHAHWAWAHMGGAPVGTPEDDGVTDWRTNPPVRASVKHLVAAPDPVA
jgi:enoyl-CoA hydratase